MRHSRFAALLVLGSLATGACSSPPPTPESIRLRCLTLAHRTVKVPESNSSNRQAMVHELYLRCLDSYGVPDAPPRAGSAN
jgi:hypothetical protein